MDSPVELLERIEKLEAELTFKNGQIKKLKSEEQLSTIIESIPDGVVVSREGNVVFVNQTAIRMVGARDSSEMLGTPILQYIHSDYVETVKARLKTAAASPGLVLPPCEQKYLGRDGKLIDVEVTTTVLTYNGLPSYLTIVRDITERKRVERLRAATEKIINHDLKTPLTGIIGFSELLMKTENISKKDLCDWAESIHRNGHYMLHMIRNSLDIYKMEEKTYQIDYRPINLIQYFVDIAADLSTLLVDKSLTIECRLDGKELTGNDEYQLKGDEFYVKSLFANLIKNAIEASPPGETISINISETDETWHQIEIHNQGAIPESIRSRFFERFASAGKSNGTGLGSYSALLIARTHGGDISFATSEEEGTTLRIILPKIVRNAGPLC